MKITLTLATLVCVTLFSCERGDFKIAQATISKITDDTYSFTKEFDFEAIQKWEALIAGMSDVAAALKQDPKSDEVKREKQLKIWTDLCNAKFGEIITHYTTVIDNFTPKFLEDIAILKKQNGDIQFYFENPPEAIYKEIRAYKAILGMTIMSKNGQPLPVDNNNYLSVLGYGNDKASAYGFNTFSQVIALFAKAPFKFSAIEQSNLPELYNSKAYQNFLASAKKLTDFAIEVQLKR